MQIAFDTAFVRFISSKTVHRDGFVVVGNWIENVSPIEEFGQAWMISLH